MAIPLFGYEFKKPDSDNELQSFATPITDDGAVIAPSSGGATATVVDLDGSIRTDVDLINKYREMTNSPEIDHAVQNIVNEAIVRNEQEPIVQIVTDDIKAPPNIREVIAREFDTTLELLEFNSYAANIMERFYVDGRLYYHAMIDPAKKALGIQKLQYLDPRTIRKIRETKPNSNAKSKVPGVQDLQVVRKEYFVFNEAGFSPANLGPAGGGWVPPSQGIKIAKDAIVYITSGKTDNGIRTKLVLSHLHKAIKPLNQLRALEDSALIYRISRAPERRIFYIDTGTLPKQKAEQHIREMMVKYKNKLVYDPNTGEIRDGRKFMTMLEDFWFSRRDGAKSTEIDVLKSGEITGVMDEVEFWQQKVYRALNVPFTRFTGDQGFSIGRDQLISQEEVQFSTFVDSLRLRFNKLFLEILKKQLILKNVIKPSDWKSIANGIKFRYARNNLFAELKNAEIQMDRFQRLSIVHQFAGIYVSHKWIRQNVLRQSEEEMKQIDGEINQEQAMVQYNPARLLTGPGEAPPGQDNQQGQQLALPPPDQEQEQDNQDNGGSPGPSANMFLMKQQLKKMNDAKNAKDNKKINTKIPAKKKSGQRRGR